MEWGGGELANQHPVRKILRKILRKWWRGQIYLRKALIGGNIAFGMGWWGAGQSASSAENLAKNLAKNLAEMVEGTNLFKKGIDWWKYSIWNGVVGSWPISIQCGKSCGNGGGDKSI